MDTNLNLDSIEGLYIKTVIEKYGLSIKWNDARWSWGPYNKETWVFGGVVSGFVIQYHKYPNSPL